MLFGLTFDPPMMIFCWSHDDLAADVKLCSLCNHLPRSCLLFAYLRMSLRSILLVLGVSMILQYPCSVKLSWFYPVWHGLFYACYNMAVPTTGQCISVAFTVHGDYSHGLT